MDAAMRRLDTVQKADIEHFRQILLKKRREIIGNVSEIEEEENSP